MGTSRSASSPKKVGVYDKMMVIRVTKLYQYDQPSFESLIPNLWKANLGAVRVKAS